MIETTADSNQLSDAGDLAIAKATALRLFSYCRTNNWGGYDPYDGLNSQVLQALPLLNRPVPRLLVTQLLKRAPVNMRRIFRVPRTQNPKGLALIIAAGLKLRQAGLLDEAGLVEEIVDQLILLRAPETKYWCWGYNFPWQTRTVFIPRGAANLVCTIFVAEALLDAFELLDDSRLLEMAASAGEYIVNELYWTAEGGIASLAYGLPESRVPVHNANLLGAALLCRLHRLTGNLNFLHVGSEVSRYSAGKQRSDGSWCYGELPSQRWVDNFHTGFNLCALHKVCRYAATEEFEPHIRRGFGFYRKHFFRKDGAPRYFHNRTYPIDIHSAAQSIITLLMLKDLDNTNIDLAQSVLRWTLKNMWHRQGYFYYQKYRYFTNRIPYMRWGQAWMLLALAELVEQRHKCE